MYLIEFLDKNRILYFPINLEKKLVKSTGKIKKMLRPYPDGKMPSYNDFSNDELVRERQSTYGELYDTIWIDTKMINQIDVDGNIDPKINTPYFKSISKDKPHYFVCGFHGLGRKRIDTKWKDVELLCGQGSYAEKTQEVYNSEVDIKNFSGNIYQIFDHNTSNSDEIERREILSCPSSNISDKLNSIFNVQGEWKSNIYEDKKSAVLIPSDRNCIVDGSKCHSCVQSFVILSKTAVKIRCHSCGEKKIDVVKDRDSWNAIRTFYGFGTQEEKMSYDLIQEHLDEYCENEDLMKKDGFIMRRSKDCAIEYEAVAPYDEFLDMIFKDADISMKRVYKKPTSKKNLINYLETIHTDINILKRDQNIVSFRNGYLKLKEFTFHPYNDNQKYTFIAKKFLPFDFDISWLNCEWTDIDCPIFDKIISDQALISSDFMVKLSFYGLLGSLHFPNGSDSIKVVPYLVGTSGTGKSTIVNIVSSTFSQENIGTINFREKTFGKSAFLTKDVIIDSDTPCDMIREFGKCEFQKAVSGEVIAIPIKNQKTENQHKVTQRMLFCSQYTQDVMDTGEVIRRIAYFSFQPVDATDSNLEDNCINTELHKVFIKIILARKKLIETFDGRPFHEWNIKYFNDKVEDVLIENNYIYRFISESDHFQMEKSSRVPFEDFVSLFHQHFTGQPNRPRKPKVSDVMFAKMKLNVSKDIVCKNCKSQFDPNVACCACHSRTNKTTKYFIDGLKISDANSFSFGDNDDVL